MIRRYVLLAAASALLAFSPTSSQAQQTSAETYRLLNLFGEVFERVRSDYVEETSDEDLIQAAINGMLTSLDPHSSYLSASDYRDTQVQTRGEFGGLGIEVTMENGLVRVISPIDDTPAYRAGVRAGDIIHEIDGEPVMGLTLNQAVERMRGAPGTDIRIGLRREGQEPMELTITRAVIKIQSVRHRIEGDIGYIRVIQFTEQTEGGVKRAVEEIKAELGKELKGFVLDLRNNPGGLLDQSVTLADAFLDKGEIVSTRARNPDDIQRFNARRGDLAEGLPMVVLINDGSASASEIVAGALQDHRRAIVLGTKSFGKGSVQTIIPLPGHGAMSLTTARYYTPSGRSIQKVGIEPDIIVEQARIEPLRNGRSRSESELRGALDNDQSPAERDAPDAEEAVDYQLLRALDLLRGIALYRHQFADFRH